MDPDPKAKALSDGNDNVVARLKRRLRDARTMGFKVRTESLDGEQATWCEIAGIPTLFVDISQTAAEQLRQVDEALAAYAAQRSPTLSTPQSSADLPNRAA